ncbi:MAG: DUF1349 domain-containing protein [Planctomycetota bacterium]
MSRFVPVFVGVGSCFLVHFVQGRLIASDANVLAYDGFDQSLALEWEPIRENANRVSLEEKPGHLTISTELGSLGGNNAAGRLPLTENLYLIENPVVDGGDFVITTCIVGFEPTQRWQQAGLIVYNDDDNYLKNDMEFSGTRVCFKFIREWEQKRLLATDRKTPDADKIWIRVVKRGNVYERLYSHDGEQFESDGELAWGDGAPKKLGVIAQNGPARAASIKASFDFFEVRKLTEEEKEDSRQKMREELEGAWSVVRCRCDGVDLDDPPIRKYEFDNTSLTFFQNGQPMTVEYQLTHEVEPFGFVMSYPEGNTSTRSKGIYRFDRKTGELTICLTLEKDKTAPDEFTTEPGDGRLLMTLERESDSK